MTKVRKGINVYRTRIRSRAHIKTLLSRCTLLRSSLTYSFELQLGNLSLMNSNLTPPPPPLSFVPSDVMLDMRNCLDTGLQDRATAFFSETRGYGTSSTFHRELVKEGFTISLSSAATLLSTARHPNSSETLPPDIEMLRVYLNDPRIRDLLYKVRLAGADKRFIYRAARADDDGSPAFTASSWCQGDADGDGISYGTHEGSHWALIGCPTSPEETSKLTTLYYDTAFKLQTGHRNGNVGVLSRIDEVTGLAVPVWAIVFSDQKVSTLMDALSEIRSILTSRGLAMGVQVLKHGEM